MAGRTTVFSTDLRRVCRRCGWPERQCTCSQTSQESVPDRLIVRLRIERAGRKGKTVTVIDGLPQNSEFLKTVATELKKACGSGGSAGVGRVEIQGDHRERLRELLRAKGWVVKG